MNILLENELIKLRAMEPEDIDFLYQWENDSSLWQFGSTLAPFSRFALKEYILNSRQDIYHSRQLRLMIVLKETGKTIGTIDLYDFDPNNLRAGVGILLDVSYRGKGIGKQSLYLIEKYAFNFLVLSQLYANIPEENQASMRLFVACGYEPAGKLQRWVKLQGDFSNVVLVQLLNRAYTG